MTDLGAIFDQCEITNALIEWVSDKRSARRSDAELADDEAPSNFSAKQPHVKAFSKQILASGCHTTECRARDDY